jgi:hypothetical protein
MIRCLYIECMDESDSEHLDHLLRAYTYPFYDATPHENIIASCNTLEEIEIQYEGK